ncbi:hypothetical protein ACFFRR_011732 [Megaselia abdita]
MSKNSPQMMEKPREICVKPMMYDAWTQTDAPFCQKYDPLPNTQPTPTELKLMEVLEALQEQLTIQTTLFHNMQIQNSVGKTETIQESAEPSNYRIIANGVLEPVEIEEINSELMHQVQSQISEEREESKAFTSYESKPTFAVAPSQNPKILNFSKPLPTRAKSTPSRNPSPAHTLSPSHDSSMEIDTSYSNASDLGNVHVSIGPNNTKIPAKIFDAIKWESASIATRKLLTTVFDRYTLATHTMTGKPSPAFKDSGKPHKEMLDQAKIKDIIFAVSRKSGVTEKEVRNVITTKCADENKMFRTKEKKRQSLFESDKENLYN